MESMDIVILDDDEAMVPVVEEPSKSPKTVSEAAVERSTSAPLKSCFRAIVKGKKVALDLKTLQIIITKDLRINMEELDSTLINILPYMLVSYMKSWPGWLKAEDYQTGVLTLDEWFDKFQKYTSFKLKFLIQKGYEKALNELKEEETPKEINPELQKSVEIQCDANELTSKAFSAFSLNIEGPPRLLNTLIFASQEDDIHVKMHTIKAWSADFNIHQLINWPFLEIEFNSPFISFTRKVSPDYLRYLARTDDAMQCRKQDFIEEVRVQSTVNRSLYSVAFLRQYLIGYIAYLKKERVPLDLDNGKMLELGTILQEFYRDIEEVGGVCENKIYDQTMISFNVGGCRYVRNKKAASFNNTNEKNLPTVGFCEVITPKCSIQLKHIHNELLSTGNNLISPTSPDLSNLFESVTKGLLESDKKRPIEKVPSLMYSCNYCKKQYGGQFALGAVLKHYQDEHRMEHAIMCFDCKQQYNVTDLSKTRWFHACGFNVYAKNPSKRKLYPDDDYLKVK